MPQAARSTLHLHPRPGHALRDVALVAALLVAIAAFLATTFQS